MYFKIIYIPITTHIVVSTISFIINIPTHNITQFNKDVIYENLK